LPGTNLTQGEAAERAALLQVDSYTIELDLSGTGDTFPSVTTIRFTANQPGAESFVDLIAPAVREVVLNGRSLDPRTVYADGRIALTDLTANNELRVVADCAYMNTGEGLHRTVDPTDGNTYLYTHFEMPDARRMFASFEQPDLKASFAFIITAPADWLVLSNSPNPSPEPLGDGRARHQFAPTARISTYLTAIAAGRYHIVRDQYVDRTGQVVPLGVACRASLAGHLDADEIFEVTRQGFDYYIEAFDQPYPFEKYDQIFVPEANGAMENVGLITFSESYLFRSKVTDASHQRRAETILHEMAHMWFGDLVTMRWWSDLWLKESFASYMAVLSQAEATRWPGAWAAFANYDKSWAVSQDQLPSTHPIEATITDLDDVQLNFDGITYAKGAAVLKQLAAWVGRDAFFTGIRAYFRRHAWGVTSLSDLLAALETASGRDLAAWSREWLQTTGPSRLRPAYTLAEDGTYASFTVEQEGSTLRSHRIAIGLYAGSPLTRVRRVELDIAGPVTPVPDLVGVARPDLVLLNDDDLTYATLGLDDHSLSTVVYRVGELSDPVARAVCWSATWSMVRNAELGGREFIGMVLGGIERETDMTAVQTCNNYLLIAVDFFVDPAFRSEILLQMATAARRGLASAEPGSDRQFVWARLFGRVATSDEDLSFIADLLAGRVTVRGLSIDTDLRWALFAALARSGRVGQAEIDAELDRDPTTAGEVNAAGARAALPTAAAKQWAWSAVVDRSDLPNHTQAAIVGGLYNSASMGFGLLQAGQRDLLGPYAQRYFAVVGDLWRTRTIHIADRLVGGLYPRLADASDTVAATDAYLASPDVPPGLRRVLIEGRDDVLRAQAAQRRDRAAGSDG
jgi:aminopeptidase N